MRLNSRCVLSVAALASLCAFVTISLQAWIGDATIYSQSMEAKRKILHQAILTNIPPGGERWGSIGAASTNLRIGSVFLAETVRGMTGLTLHNTYRVLDSVFLFAVLVSLFFYLRLWLPDSYALIGLLYFSACLPLSYFLYFFHPWDRPQLLLWIALLYLTKERRFLLLLGTLSLSMIVKFDTILLPGLYFVAHIMRDQWRSVVLETSVLAAGAILVYVGLGALFPAPADPWGYTISAAVKQVLHNVEVLRAMTIKYPPILGHALPIVLAVINISRRPRFVWCSVLFAGGLLFVWFLFSNFDEIRAQMVVPVLLLPAALMTLRELLEKPNVDRIDDGRMRMS